MCRIDRGLRRVAVASMVTITPTSETYAASLHRSLNLYLLPCRKMLPPQLVYFYAALPKGHGGEPIISASAVAFQKPRSHCLFKSIT